MRRVRRTCLEMLRDRRYAFDQSELDLSKEQFQQRYVAPDKTILWSQMTIVAVKSDDATERVVVYFLMGEPDGKIGVNVLRTYFTNLVEKSVKSAVFVVKTGLPPASKRIIQEFTAAKEINVEVFLDSELLVNITHHELVPKHVPLSGGEKQALLERYKLKDTQLPRMQVSDPVARYFGLKRGQVVKIIRDSETAGRYVTYRLVF
jgi:DNA-directed RNA polymerase I, II, and III subunit RPABC1